MTLLSTIGTALPSASIGFLIGALMLRGKLAATEMRAVGLARALAGAAGTLRFMGQTAAADQVFEALADGSGEC